MSIAHCFSECNIRYLPQISQKKISNLGLSKIENIIFDLGGVIIGLDTARTVSEMARLVGISEDEAFTVFQSDEHFKRYETGHISDEEFRSFIRSLSNRSISDEEVDFAWNAMILDIPDEHYSLLQDLSKVYRVHLLSNTNNIHLKYVNDKISSTGMGNLSDYFELDFYSHLMGLRKPNVEIFERVLEEGKMNASSTLFLDDNLDNLSGARGSGIQTLHVAQLSDTLRFFHER